MLLMAEGSLVSRVENENVLVLERVFHAPRDVLFAMFTREEHLKRWWSPSGWEITYSAMDFRVGGGWHYCMKCVDQSQGEYFGMESWNKAVYTDIENPGRVAYVDHFSDPAGNVDESMPSSRIATEFVESGGVTKVISRAEYASAGDLRKVLDMGVLEGVSDTWDRLATYLGEFMRK